MYHHSLEDLDLHPLHVSSPSKAGARLSGQLEDTTSLNCHPRLRPGFCLGCLVIRVLDA
jgi:hypothetical protein